MESRKVIIVTSGGQKKQVIETGAETLAQLKADLDRAGIDYRDKTFFEGLSKTELTHDDSLLPRDIPRNGGTTNNLVFMLTTPQKKIKSGAMNRQEAYAEIKKKGLQEECIKKFGKNFTMCKTDDLISLILSATKKAEPKAEPVIQQPCVEEPIREKKEVTKDEPNTVKAIKVLLDVLYENDVIDSEDADTVLCALTGEGANVADNSPYTNAELDEIIKGCNM